MSISERRFTVHAFHASVVKSWPFSCARNVSSSSAGWPATSWAAAVSAAARCAITSRFHQPAAALGSSHESGSANWIMRPSRWRSACAMPTRSSRLIVTCRVGLPAPFGADCTVAAMRVLVCPDKFRGTLTARQAGEAIERGWRRARPDDVIDVLPLADGGEGTLDVLAPSEDGRARRVIVRVAGPLGDPVDAAFGLRGETGVIEMARASGLELVPPDRRDPSRTTTRGTGELMAAAMAADARRLLVCLGGSATNDGGVGMAAALGGRFLDAAGEPIGNGGGSLIALDRIDAGPVLEVVRTVEVIGVTDVDNPLCGPVGASVVFGPQKGASPDDVIVLDRALAHLAAVAAPNSAPTGRGSPARAPPAGSGSGCSRSREPGSGVGSRW